MLFSQLALIVLVVLAMVTGYVPWWLGVLTLVVWGTSKLLMRGIIGQVERRGLQKQRLAGSKLEVEVEAVGGEPGADSGIVQRFWLDVTIEPPHADVEWFPLELEAFEIDRDQSQSCPIEACMIWHGDTFIPCSESVTGTGRVRLLIETLPTTSAVVLSHQEERLGSVPLRK